MIEALLALIALSTLSIAVIVWRSRASSFSDMVKWVLECLNGFRWVVLAFIAAGLLISGLLVWQLWETRPGLWCTVAEVNDISAAGCFQLLLALIEVKDHAIIGLLVILGLTVLSVVAVTLKVRINADIPGGGNLNIEEGRDDA